MDEKALTLFLRHQMERNIVGGVMLQRRRDEQRVRNGRLNEQMSRVLHALHADGDDPARERSELGESSAGEV